jgi:hypothetical protein
MSDSSHREPCVACGEDLDDPTLGTSECSFPEGRRVWLCTACTWACLDPWGRENLASDLELTADDLKRGMEAANARIPMEVRERRMAELGLAVPAWDADSEPPRPFDLDL